MAKKKDLLTVYGRTGTQFWAGQITNPFEYNKDLKGTTGLNIYNKMRRSDGQVAATLLALELPIVNAKWDLIPPEDADENEIAITEYCKWWFFRKMNFTKVLSEAVHGRFWAGHAVFEKIFAYDDSAGYWYIDALSPRLQTTIEKWVVKNDKLVAIKQRVYTEGFRSELVEIPIEKLVIFTYRQEGNDYRGRSILRNAYQHWWFKQNMYKIGAIAAERGGVGIPYAKLPAGATDNLRDSMEEILANIRANQQAEFVIPEGVDVGILTIEAKVDENLMPQIKHHDEMISRSILAQFLNLGTTETGARAVGEVFLNLFMKGLAGEANIIANVFQTQVIDEVVKLNWNIDEDRYPKLIFSGIELEDVAALGTFLSQASGFLTPNLDTENWLRQKVGMPVIADDENVPEEPQAEEGEEEEQSNKTPFEDRVKIVPFKDHTCAIHAQDYLTPDDDLRPPYQPAELETDLAWNFWRKPTRLEQLMSLREIDGRLDDGIVRLVVRTDTAREAVVKDLGEQARAVLQSGNAKAVLRISLNKNLVKDLALAQLDELESLYEYGRAKVEEEKKRQLAEVKRPEAVQTKQKIKPENKKSYLNFLLVNTLQQSEKALAAVVDSIQTRLLNALKTGQGDVERIIEEASNLSKRKIESAVSGLVHDAFSAGRAAKAEEDKKQIKYAILTAILDASTCAGCQAVDGKKVMLGTADYEKYRPPLVDICYGGAKCRCMYIYVYEESLAE